jgi:hypothetical protein
MSVDNPNKPLTEKEITIFKQKSRIAIMIYILLSILIFALNKTFALSLSLGIMSVALSLLASAVIRKGKVLQ